MTTLEAIQDALNRGWSVTFLKDRLAPLTVRATWGACPKIYGQEWHTVETDDHIIAQVILRATNDRKLPHNELADLIAERRRRDPDAPPMMPPYDRLDPLA